MQCWMIITNENNVLLGNSENSVFIRILKNLQLHILEFLFFLSVHIHFYTYQKYPHIFQNVKMQQLLPVIIKFCYSYLMHVHRESESLEKNIDNTERNKKDILVLREVQT